MTTRTFTREQLDALGLPDDTVTADQAAEYPTAAVELHREQIDSRRWASVHRLIFRAPDDGKAYRVYYTAALTEMQYSDAWNEADTVEAVEVEEYDRTVKAWRPVSEQPTAAEGDEPIPYTRTGQAATTTSPDALRYWIAVDVPAADVDDDLNEAISHAADRAERVLQEERGYNATAWQTGRPDDEQPAAPRVLTDDEYATVYVTASRNRGTIDDTLTAAFAAVGILMPPPPVEPDTCPAQFAPPNGEWQQCTDEPGHDPADGHDSGDWSWADGQRFATPEPDEAQQ